MRMRHLILAALAACLGGPAWAQTQVVTTPFGTTTAQTLITIATGGTFQTAAAANSSRKGCLIQNISSHTLYVFFGVGTPSTSNSLQVAPSGTVSCSNQAGIVATDLIRVTTSTTNDTAILTLQ
jgi:hypothetical protein